MERRGFRAENSQAGIKGKIHLRLLLSAMAMGIIRYGDHVGCLTNLESKLEDFKQSLNGLCFVLLQIEQNF